MTAPAIVPEDVLVPPDAHARGLHRHEAALVLDGWLRRLAGQEARCRAVLGGLARVFLRRHGQRRLGFARLEDYARERLGMSGRELHSLAAVMGRMEALPRIGAAFDCGALSWSHVRLLVSVATARSEAAWIALARGRTVRALEALIREAGHQLADGDESEGTEPRGRFRLRCPRRLVRRWREVVELARRIAGANLSAGQAAEVIAAEGLSAQSADAGTWPDATRSHEEPADPGETHAAFAEALDWSPVAEAMPEEVEALARGRDHLDPFVIDTRMRALVRVQQQVGWQTGRLLRVLADRRLYRLMGFPSLARYLRERLGMSERRARALVALERRSWEAPALGTAYRAGDLSWVQALTVLPVATDETAAAWVERAQQVTVRCLADEVEWTLAGCVPRDPVSPPPPHAALETINERERQTCALGDDEWPDAEIAFSAPASVVALFRTAILTFTRRGEPLWKGLGQLLDHVRAEWSAQPRHRDPVFERDGWRCRVPGCSARRNLHDHHIVFRSQGGANRRANRTTICAAHHLRGIHAGYVRAWGTAPDEITWELGVRPGREPLLRLKGDWYLS